MGIGVGQEALPGETAEEQWQTAEEYIRRDGG